VAEKDVKLEENDEAYFEAWIKSNYEKFWKDTGVRPVSPSVSSHEEVSHVDTCVGLRFRF
jgi:hypothetical protein